MSAPGRWADLSPRLASAVVMITATVGSVWLGGGAFDVFVALICAAMTWELVRMVSPDTPAAALQLAFLTGAGILLADFSPPAYVLPLLLAPALVGLTQVSANRSLFAGCALWIAVAGYGFHFVRDAMGLVWMIWLICLVIATDVAGYFVGKSVGGPKFWPRVSPKKTWSGTVAGWIAAALVGALFGVTLDLGPNVALYSILAAMAAQAGDIAESALKRRMKVKDSSALIPGHGGFLDRFDGMMGASVFVLLTGLVLAAPEGGL